MNWCVRIDSSDLEMAINKAIGEAATLGREIAGCVSIGPTSMSDHVAVLLIFRPIPRGAPAHVTATIIDRNGYPR